MRIAIFSIITLVCVLDPLTAISQYEQRISNDVMGLQYGFSLKASFEIGGGRGDADKKPYNPKSSIRISASGGISSNFIISELHPSLNVEFLLYCGGIGSQLPGSKTQLFNLDIITALTMTAGTRNLYTKNNMGELQYRLSPLYYFSSFTYPSLRNPYHYSLSVGTDFIFTTDGHRSAQRIGFVNLNFDKVQLSYYNDGGFVLAELNLGDGKDRYYTGGGVISYHGRTYEAINLVELSFDKFTGFSKYAFEVSNALDLGFVDYKDKSQGSYNKSLYTLNVANVTQGWNGFVKSYNWSKADAQHRIHTGLFNAFHVVPYQGFVAVGGQFLYSRLQSHTR